MKRILFFLPLFFSLNIFGQNFWKVIRDENAVIKLREADRGVIPQQYTAYSIDLQALKDYLAGAPDQFNPLHKSLPLSLPMPDGKFMLFDITYSPVMEPGLSDKFPQIRSYKGVCRQKRDMNIRFDIGEKGFFGAIYDNGKSLYIDPYADGVYDYNISYWTKDYKQDLSGFNLTCGVDSAMIIDNQHPFKTPYLDQFKARKNITDCIPVLQYNYRLALACTGEWGKKHGGTKASALSDMVTLVNRVNQIYENEFAIHLNLIADNDKLIWLDSETDPFDVANQGAVLLDGINQVIIDNIGYQNFDIGHIITNSCTDVGGIAMVGGVCNINIKGSGVTCHYTGDLNYIAAEVTAHEMGHQFSAFHTFNNCSGNESSTGYEPGGGTTIMAYCNLCGPNDVDAPCLNNFHSFSIEQILSYTRVGFGNTCAVKKETDNTYPTVILDYNDGFFIPKNTPFVLEGDATDCEDTDLSYSWEEIDAGPQSPIGQPQADSPIFTALEPNSSKLRYFPNLKSIVYNTFNNSEVLPTYERNLTFRFIARDNHSDAGGASWADMNFKVDGNSGPFYIITPALPREYKVNEGVEITWDPANTTNQYVNCKYVDIYMSVDVGYTFPYLLKYHTPNDGKDTVYMPDTLTTKAKFMIKGGDNIFFALGKYSNSIKNPSVPTFVMEGDNINGRLCQSETVSTVIKTRSINSYDKNIRFELIGLPPSATYTFSPTTIKAGESTTLTVNLKNTKVDGHFYPLVLGISDSGDTVRFQISWDLLNNDYSNLGIISPLPGEEKVSINPVFKWNKNDGAEKTNFYISKNPAFPKNETFILNDVADTTAKSNTLLDYATIYYWKLEFTNKCGLVTSDTTYSFITPPFKCRAFISEDVPIFLNDNLPCLSDLKIEEDLNIADINVVMKGTHSAFKELNATLISPDSTERTLFPNKSTSYQGNFNLVFDDQANQKLKSFPSGTFQPEQTLSIFNNKSSLGTWTLKIIDTKDQLSGVLNDFELEMCYPFEASKLLLLKNDLLLIPVNTLIPIDAGYLKADRETGDVAANKLLYTITKLPAKSVLVLNDDILHVGDKFTQDDINNNRIKVRTIDSTEELQKFYFTVQDDNGGWITITPFSFRSEKSLKVTNENFKYQVEVYPNPTNDYVNLNIISSGTYRVQILDLNGKVLYNDKAEGNIVKYIDFNQMSSGLYLIRIFNDSYNYVKKIVKQ